MEVSAWPGAYAIPAAAGARPASTRAVAPDANPARAAHPLIPNRPAVTAAPNGVAGPAQPALHEAEAPPPAGVAGAGGRTTATRLGPEYGDPRLAAPPPPSRGPLGDAARFETQFRVRWRVFRDSIQHDMDRERLAATWTWKDATGRAWSVRDGGVFIDGRRVMAMEMYGERDQTDAARMQSTARREIARQAEDIERDRYIQRGRATRSGPNRDRGEARP